jgi:transposase InsO family protein
MAHVRKRNAFARPSDCGSKYVSIKYSERLTEAGIEPSVDTNGNSYDNTLHGHNAIKYRRPQPNCEEKNLKYHQRARENSKTELH